MTKAIDDDARWAEKKRKQKAARDKILARKTKEKGLLMVHTGKGKGKTTAAMPNHSFHITECRNNST